jgi:predicted amidohydrolase
MQQTQKTQSGQRDPHRHVKKVAGQLQELIDHLRTDIENIDEPRCKAMFETSAEVLGGLKKRSKTTRPKAGRRGAEHVSALDLRSRQIRVHRS